MFPSTIDFNKCREEIAGSLISLNFVIDGASESMLNLML